MVGGGRPITPLERKLCTTVSHSYSRRAYATRIPFASQRLQHNVKFTKTLKIIAPFF